MATRQTCRAKISPLVWCPPFGHTGEDISIAELAELMAKVTGYSGRISYEGSRPDGTPRKLLDVSLLSGLCWRASIGLEEGVRRTYAWFLDHAADAQSIRA